MRYFVFLIFVCCMPVYAVTPIRNDYTKPQDVFDEMRNLTDNCQDQSFTIVNSTPNYQDLKEGAFVIYKASANAVDVFLMLRAGTTLYVSPNYPIVKGR